LRSAFSRLDHGSLALRPVALLALLSELTRFASSHRELLLPGFRRFSRPPRRRISLRCQLGNLHRRDSHPLEHRLASLHYPVAPGRARRGRLFHCGGPDLARISDILLPVLHRSRLPTDLLGIDPTARRRGFWIRHAHLIVLATVCGSLAALWYHTTPNLFYRFPGSHPLTRRSPPVFAVSITCSSFHWSFEVAMSNLGIGEKSKTDQWVLASWRPLCNERGRGRRPYESLRQSSSGSVPSGS
jgi:hypothetical protein